MPALKGNVRSVSSPRARYERLSSALTMKPRDGAPMLLVSAETTVVWLAERAPVFIGGSLRAGVAQENASGLRLQPAAADYEAVIVGPGGRRGRGGRHLHCQIAGADMAEPSRVGDGVSPGGRLAFGRPRDESQRHDARRGNPHDVVDQAGGAVQIGRGAVEAVEDCIGAEQGGEAEDVVDVVDVGREDCLFPPNQDRQPVRRVLEVDRPEVVVDELAAILVSGCYAISSRCRHVGPSWGLG